MTQGPLGLAEQMIHSRPSVCLHACVLLNLCLHATSWWEITGMDHVSNFIFILWICVSGTKLEARQMVIFLALCPLANS